MHLSGTLGLLMNQMARTLAVTCIVALGGSLVQTSAASAHGPCGCLDPVLTQAGKQVRVGPEQRQSGTQGVPAYRILFNPRPGDFGIAPGYLASAYRADAPTTTVLSRSRHKPTRKARFRVPRATPPGLYMVLIWDGEEGGGHNTWDYLHVVDWDERAGRGVTAAGQPPITEEAGSSTPGRRPEQPVGPSTAWPVIAAVGMAGIALVIAGVLAVRRWT